MEQTSYDHPAADWARGQRFTPQEVDCTTAVVLKILDGKCKMRPGEMAAVIAVYEVVRDQPAPLFDTGAHRLIDAACRGEPDDAAIHTLRCYAEEQIPKPVMKAYKAVLRAGLFE